MIILGSHQNVIITHFCSKIMNISETKTDVNIQPTGQNSVHITVGNGRLIEQVHGIRSAYTLN